MNLGSKFRASLNDSEHLYFKVNPIPSGTAIPWALHCLAWLIPPSAGRAGRSAGQGASGHRRRLQECFPEQQFWSCIALHCTAWYCIELSAGLLLLPGLLAETCWTPAPTRSSNGSSVPNIPDFVPVRRIFRSVPATGRPRARKTVRSSKGRGCPILKKGRFRKALALVARPGQEDRFRATCRHPHADAGRADACKRYGCHNPKNRSPMQKDCPARTLKKEVLRSTMQICRHRVCSVDSI